ncbi:OprO/OprP family phosphate-selective porin [Caldithrix abyssi]
MKMKLVRSGMLLLLLLLPGLVKAQSQQQETKHAHKMAHQGVSGETTYQISGVSEWRNGIYFWESQDGAFWGRFDTRIFINGAYFFENKNKLSNGTHLRKGRFAVKVNLWRVWYMEWDMDMAEGVVEAKDMFLAYHGFKNAYLKFGHFKMPFGLNILTSSRFIPFAERAYNALAFKMGRRMGLEYGRWTDWWNFRGAIYGQTFDTNKNKTKDETGGGVAARLASAPLQNATTILHLGISAAWTKPDDQSNIVQFDSEPETKIGDVEILDTDYIRNVDYTTRLGLEGAAVYRNFHLQGEYNLVRLNRLQNLPEAQFSAGYVYLLWSITGESRRWDKTQGEFSQLIPRDVKKGAWEVGLRYSHLNLSDTDAGILGGRANNYTLGLNWYPNPNMVFQLNYTYVSTSPNATGNGFVGDDRFSYVQFMTKFFF